ncbi:MAG: hypothetical protein PVI43_00550 [Candidatus Bathyarchaeota archaeon]
MTPVALMKARALTPFRFNRIHRIWWAAHIVIETARNYDSELVV